MFTDIVILEMNIFEHHCESMFSDHTQTLKGQISLHFCANWPQGYKNFSCSTQLSMKFSLLINMKMPTIVGIFIFISREIFMLSYVMQVRIVKPILEIFEKLCKKLVPSRANI